MEIVLIILLVFYLFSAFGTIEPICDRDVEMNFFTFIIVFTPILNTYLAIKYAKWGEVKKLFEEKKKK